MARTSRTGTRTDLALLGAALAVALVSLILPSVARGRLQGALRSSIGAPLVAAQAWAERGREAIGDHGRLVQSVDSLSRMSQDAVTLRSENDRLRGLIGLGQRLAWGFVVTEMLPSPKGGDEHTVLLSAGGAAGVRPFSALVVPEGLVGMVTSVEAGSSTAILWTHPDFRASATTPDGLAFGIVAAHLGSGADRFLLEMRGVPFRSELKPGTMIVSSGLGNVFPRGIPIGVVLRETKTVEGWARTYLLRPIVSPDAASAVAVLLPSRAAAGVNAAWSSAAAAEGTQKAIVAAGDSILADSVRKIEAQLAKLAQLDSLRRAAIYGGDSGVRVEADPAPSTVSGAPGATPIPAPPVTSPATPVPAPPTPSTTAITPPITKPSAVPPVTVTKPATTVPQPSGARTPSTGARRDTTRRVTPPRPRVADTTRKRAKPDSAAGKNRREPAENPFRLPRAGAFE